MSSRRSSSRRLRNRRARAGFTLVELMIALVTGGMVIGAMYAVSSASSRHFQVQHQVANMQSALRFAYVQIKRDVMRAGYQATPRADLDECMPTGISANIDLGGSGWIAGISSFRNDVAPNLVDPTGNNGGMGFTHDEITMIGNYTTSNEYPGVIVLSANQIQIDATPTTTWHSIQSDFGWNPVTQIAQAAVDPAVVARVFPTGGLIRIQTTANRRHYATLVNAATVGGTFITLTFAPGLPGQCQADAIGGWVAPLNVIRYGAAMSVAGTPESDRITGAIPQLVRTEVQPVDKVTTVANQAPTVILDYLAAFNLSFTMNRLTPQGAPDNYPDLIGVPTNNQGAVNQNPELVRAVTVELAVRAPSVDTGAVFPPPGGPPLAQLQVMQLHADAPARGARVRFLRSEIFVPNIAYEGY